jgi:hypothetical protein
MAPGRRRSSIDRNPGPSEKGTEQDGAGESAPAPRLGARRPGPVAGMHGRSDRGQPASPFRANPVLIGVSGRAWRGQRGMWSIELVHESLQEL